MYDYPIKYFADNLIFNNSQNECWAYFKLGGIAYDFLKEESKIQALNTLALFISNIGQEAKIHIVPIAQDVNSHYDRLTEELDKTDPLYRKTLAHATGTRDHINRKIKSKGMSNDFNIYVGTKLTLKESILKDLKDAVQYLLLNPLKTLEEVLGTKNKVIMEREIELFKELSTEYFKRQNKRIRLYKTDETTTQWLNRRAFRRGLGEVKVRDNWYNSIQGRVYRKRNRVKVQREWEAIERTMQRPWSPFTERTIKNGEYARLVDTGQVLTLAEGLIDQSEGRTLKIHHSDDRTSYQAFLSISHIPDGIIFPGSEWLLVLQDLPLQTEVCIHIETKEHKESIRSVGKQKRDIKGQIEHVVESHEEIPEDLLDAEENANLLEVELKATRSPITRASITICVAADNKEELEDRAAFIKELYEDQNFMIERSYSDQLKLFLEFIPGTGRYVTDYIQPLPPRTLAGSMFAATRQLGDNTGPYIGTTGAVGKNVYLDMGRACLLNRSASAFFYGTLGGGKSFNANLMAYLNVMYGGKALIFDPKGERSKWLELLPELKGYINIITLSPSQEDKGKLDPYIVYRDSIEEASELATNILAEIFKLNPKDDEYIAVLEAVNQMKKMENRCMIKLSDILDKFPEDDELAPAARKLGRRIKLLRENGMAGLLFGDGTEEALSFKNRINILQIQNLALPKAGTPKEDLNQEEVISTVLMLPIASFAKKFAMSGEDCFKSVVFDESWGLKATTMGLKLMDFLARMGRSLYGGCSFIGHSVDDLGEGGIKNAISYKFCFKMAERSETIKALEFMKLEITEENIMEIETLGNGECLFQDLDGRVGKLKFDVVFEHLLEAFKTTPSKKKAGEGDELPT